MLEEDERQVRSSFAYNETLSCFQFSIIRGTEAPLVINFTAIDAARLANYIFAAIIKHEMSDIFEPFQSIPKEKLN